MLIARIAFAVAGLGLLAYGAFQLVTHVPPPILLWVAVWLIAVVLVHDAVIAPGVVGVGWVIGTYVPPRARRYLQAGLITAAMITVIAVPLMLRQGTQPPAKAMLLQDYAVAWVLLLVEIAIVLGAAYLIRRARDTAKVPG